RPQLLARVTGETQVARLCTVRLGELHPRGAGPQSIEVIEIAHRLIEHVNNHVAVIDHHPLAPWIALDREWPYSRAREVVLDPLRDGLDLSIGAPRADEEIIGERRQPPNLHHDQVVGLLLEGKLNAQQRLAATVNGSQCDRTCATYSPWRAM